MPRMRGVRHPLPGLPTPVLVGPIDGAGVAPVEPVLEHSDTLGSGQLTEIEVTVEGDCLCHSVTHLLTMLGSEPSMSTEAMCFSSSSIQ